MSQIQVPKGWNIESVGKICNEIYRYPTYYGISYEKEGVPEIRGTLIRKNGELEKDLKQYRLISKKTSQSFPKTILKEGDIVMTVRGTMGKIGLVPKFLNDANITANLMRMSPKRELCTPEFLKYFFMSEIFQSELLSRTSSTTIKTIQAPKLKSIKVPLPPRIIQKKIVQKLDYVLEQLEKKKKDILDLKKKLEKNFSEIPPSFKNRIESKNNLFLIIKNKIFENGFNGKLSAEYRKNKMKYEHDWFRKIETQRSSLINKNKKKTKKRDVFQILDKDDPSLPRIPSEWIWTNIASLETMVGSGSTPKGGKSNYVEKGIPFIRSQNVLFNELDLSNVVYISEEIHSKMNRTYVKANDVLLNITGASIGRASSVSTNFKNGNVNQHVCIIRTGSWMNPDYLSFWLNSSYIQNFIYDIEIGATKEGLNFEQVRTFPVPLPKIEEQDIIVKQIQKKLSELQLVKTQTTNAKQFYQTSMNELEKISQSILNSAFTGKLIS